MVSFTGIAQKKSEGRHRLVLMFNEEEEVMGRHTEVILEDGDELKVTIKKLAGLVAKLRMYERGE